MMLCIQDPSYENSKYLHETLLSECVGCTAGAGAYAFATKDGINLLLSDDNFSNFLKQGTFCLVVGTDDITNERSIHALAEMKKRYGAHLVVKAYVHSGKGSTFHPKFSWFRKADGGSLVIGSGNLTQKGLRRNREAYSVIQYDEVGITAVVEEWDRWFSHSAPFLFDITASVVLAKAKQNAEKARVISEVKSTFKKNQHKQEDEIGLADIYKMQSNGQTVHKEAPSAEDAYSKEAASIIQSSPIADEGIDEDYWIVSEESPVLIAEIPKSGNRWKQANFDKNSFQHYFGATCGENGEYRILLKSVNADGSMNETEVRPSVSVSSKNYRFELDAANGLLYPKGNQRPIAMFAKVSCRDFLYQLFMPESDYYNEIWDYIGKTKAPSRFMRRLEYVAGDVCKEIPGLAIWKRLHKEDGQ